MDAFYAAQISQYYAITFADVGIWNVEF